MLARNSARTHTRATRSQDASLYANYTEFPIAMRRDENEMNFIVSQNLLFYEAFLNQSSIKVSALGALPFEMPQLPATIPDIFHE